MLRTLAILVLLAGTASADSKADVKTDYDNLCNAIERSGAAKMKNKSERAQTIANYLKKTIKTDEVKKLLGSLASLPPDQAGPTVKDAAKKAGYTGPCPMVDAK